MTVGMNDNRAMPARLSAFTIWALVAAGLVFWGYRLWASPVAASANVQVASVNTGVRGDLSRLLGAAPVTAAPAPVAQSSRYRLLGVLAPRPTTGAEKPSTAGVALIAVDGKQPRAFVVGAKIDGDVVLQSVSRRSASIGPAQGAANAVLELPPPAPPTTGSLPKAVEGEPTRGVAPPQAPQPAAPPPVAMPPQMPQQVIPQVGPQAPPPQQADPSTDDEAPTPTPSRSRRGGIPLPASR
jgi:general secretion pathway protein C